MSLGDAMPARLATRRSALASRRAKRRTYCFCRVHPVRETSACAGFDLRGWVLHTDNGGTMKGATMLATLQRLGGVPSFSRPRVSDDNPFIESRGSIGWASAKPYQIGNGSTFHVLGSTETSTGGRTPPQRFEDQLLECHRGL